MGSSVVTVSGDYIGKFIEMISLPNHEVYVISNDEKEVLIPVVSEFIHSVNISDKVISITPVEGLLNWSRISQFNVSLLSGWNLIELNTLLKEGG